MTAASVTITSPAASGSSPASGRNVFAVGNRMVGKFKVAINDSYATGGVAADFRTYFPYPIAEVIFTPHVLVANVLLTKYAPGYDFVNRKITLVNADGAAEANGTDVTGLVYDVTLWSE
jgi:hypothetical protein